MEKILADDVRKIELLAPAQNKKCALCAIESGADSIYIGANLFGARKNAANSLDDIKEIINYAHKFSVKIYITINTILNDDELLEAEKLIKNLHRAGADGIIFQDMGILELAIEGRLPDIKLIASTQCDNRTLEKVKFFEKTGVKKVILARELSMAQIENICKNTNCEIETFIHGALCVSYSGQCYLSHKIGGRSANRGECAQICRKKYSLINDEGKILAQDKYLLSMKDFMAAKYLERLINAGVTSFKIEGRLKDENYIKNTVGYYRKLFDEIIEKHKENRAKQGLLPEFKKSSSGDVFFDFEPCLTKSFNRDFCEYFLDGRKNNIYNFDTPNSKGEFLGKIKNVQNAGAAQFFTIDNNDIVQNLHPQDGLCYIENGPKGKVLCGFLINSIKNGKIYPNVAQNFKPGVKIYRNKDFNFENILKNSKTKRRIGAIFRVFDDYIECIDEDNNLIKENFEKGEAAKNIQTTKKSWENALKKSGNSDFYIKDVKFLSKDIYFLPAKTLNEIRRRALEKLMDLRLLRYRENAANLMYGTKYTHSEYPLQTGDYRLNVHNKTAEKFYEKCNCKVAEYSLESGTSAKGKELMRTKHCIRYSLNMCLKNCGAKKGETLFLTDEKGGRYKLFFDCKNCEMVLLG